MVGAQIAIRSLESVDPKSTALKNEIQSINQLQTIEAKISQHYEKHDYRTAVYHIDSALKIATNCLRYKLLKAECLAMLGRTEQANDIAVSAMKSDSNSADAIFVRGLCLYYNDNIEKGLLHFERCIALDPDHKKAKVFRIKAKNLKETKERGDK